MIILSIPQRREIAFLSDAKRLAGGTLWFERMLIIFHLAVIANSFGTSLKPFSKDLTILLTRGGDKIQSLPQHWTLSKLNFKSCTINVV